MRDEIDDILRSRLHNVEIHEGLPNWERIEESVGKIEEGDSKKKKTIFLFGTFIGKAAIVIVVIGLGIGGFFLLDNKPSSNLSLVETNNSFKNNQLDSVDSSNNGDNNEAEIRPDDVSLNNIFEDVISGDGQVNVKLSKDALVIKEEGEIRNPISNLGLSTDLINVRVNDIFFASLPKINPLQIFKGEILDMEETKYNIEDYFADFYQMYNNNDESVKSWSFRFFPDILSINKNSEDLTIGTEESLSIYNYLGKTYSNDKLVFLVDRKLVVDYKDILPSMSIEYKFDKLVHRFPISCNIGIRKSVGNKWGLETGIVYTYMESYTGALIRNSIFFKQQLQYLGAPVVYYYNLFSTNSLWSIELRGGLLTEINISTLGTTSVYENFKLIESSVYNEVPSNLMLSTNLGFGFGYKLFKDFGIYMEPSMAYYFYTKGQPLSYKTDRPLSFNLKAGIRFDF